MSDAEEVAQFLEVLTKSGKLALVPGRSARDLVPIARPILEASSDPATRAERLSAALIDSPTVEDLFVDDDELAAMVSAFDE